MNYKERIGNKENPRTFKTPPQSSQFIMHVDEKEGKKISVCTVKSTVFHYDIRCIEDLYKMLKKLGDWLVFGSKDEKVKTKPDAIEHWSRSPNNPIGSWYGLKKELRGRFGLYTPPHMEAVELVEVTHEKRENKMKAK